MTAPIWSNGLTALYQADAREIPLPDGSVHSVVTSPPYFGQRDYSLGDTGIGLESTLEEWVANIIAVSREVWRVLRNDGTYWLNLGDSYWGGGRGMKLDGTHSDGALQSRNVGSLGLPVYRGRVPRAGRNDKGGKALLGSDADGQFSQSLCDECANFLTAHSLGTGGYPGQESATAALPSTLEHTESSACHPENSHSTSLDGQTVAASPEYPPSPNRVDGQPLVSLESTPLGFSQRSPAGCWHCDNCASCLSVLRSSDPYALVCADTGWRLGTDGIGQIWPAFVAHNSGIDPSFAAYPYSTIRPLKPKDLVGQPWRVALALQDDGWWLRSEIIWHKPNPMPGSQKDRPTSSHETIFLMSKRGRYFYDPLGFRLPAKTERWPGIGPKHVEIRRRGEVYEDMPVNETVNLRDVWTFPPQSHAHAHEAAFPDELPRRCILLGTSARGVCAECGAPYRRQTETPKAPDHLRNRGSGTKMDYHPRQVGSGQALQNWREANPTQTIGWESTCDHNAARVPATVLDPFVGSGTTCAVAQQLGRRSVGIDLNEDYLLNIARPRIEGIALPMELGV